MGVVVGVEISFILMGEKMSRTFRAIETRSRGKLARSEVRTTLVSGF